MEQLVREILAERLPECEVEVKELSKNGITKTGINIMQSGINISEIIYIDELLKASNDPDEIVDKILEIHNKRKPNKSVDMSFFNREYILDNVFPALFKKENAQDSVHTDVLDMAFTYKVKVNIPDDEDGMCTVKILQQHIDEFNITTEELHATAMENLRKSGIFRNIVDVLSEVMGPMMDEIDSEIYVVSNRNGMYGATHMFNRNLMNDLLETMKTDAAYVIPSSIHECIVMPIYEDVEKNFILDMIHEVNRSEVVPEEVLTDTLYKYTRENGLEIA